jgi:DNA-binding LytR/AlgR family response regulator
MAETEALLPAPDFIRIHRSYIVSRRHINKLEKNKVYCDRTSIPVGSAYVTQINKIMLP